MSTISALSAGSSYDYSSRLFSKMDTDKNGSVSQDEFVNARPDDVSESQASKLFESLDTSGSGSLSESDIQKMEDNKKSGSTSSTASLDSDTLQALLQAIGAMTLTSDSSSTSSASQSSGSGQDLSSQVSAMDTNGDGVVTQEEFLAARPDNVSEDMATNLWKSFDTDGTGSMSTDDLKTAMADNRPPPPPSGAGGTNETDEDSSYQAWLDQLMGTSSDSSTTSLAQLFSTDSSSSTDWASLFQKAVASYQSSSLSNSSSSLATSLMSAV